MEEANEIIEDLLNEQSALLWSWRSHLYKLLTRKLSTSKDDSEADGQEYARTLDTQGEAEAYLQAYAALLADRREVLVAERTLLAAHDGREKKLRHTKAARKAAAALQSDIEILDSGELEPEHEVLRGTLSDQRKELIQQFQGRAIKSILFDLNAVVARLNDKDPEKIIAKQCVADLRQLISAQCMNSIAIDFGCQCLPVDSLSHG
jgi:E3 ubiquitin-protein ligase SHPRH